MFQFKKLAIASAITASLMGVSNASASTTMYNTFTTTVTTETDGWTHTNGKTNSGALQPWVGTSGYTDTRPFNYVGSSHLNWAVQLTGAGDSAEISAADSQKYGVTAEIDTGGGAWRDNSTSPVGGTGWKHQTDIGLIQSDVTQQIHINLVTLGNLTPTTFSRFGVTVFDGMDTNTGSYSHHGAWNNINTTATGSTATQHLYTMDNPFGTTGLTNIGYSDNVDGTTSFTFTALAGHVYSLYLGGVDFSKWNTGVDNYKLTMTTSPVPVPGAVWLFGSAIAGLVGFGRRKAISA